ncbi:MAG: sugar ABC transporter ATP-binding protein [Verrucomicrobiae bacterium]|nr:sugar ABC transporter ATP-binding protein [Verrucomicrobiae bacterium]
MNPPAERTAAGPDPGSPTPVVAFRGICKAFFGVPVLRNVSFEVQAGRITGLVGENGAGKSTLMNLLGGDLRADAGTLLLRGRTHAPRSPREAREAGIGFVHQELNLFPNLTIAENLFLTGFPTEGPFIRRASLRNDARSLLQRVGLDLPPETLVGRLSAGEGQLVEVAHALSLDAQLILLDEPTSSLSLRESERLFTLMRQLRDEGRAVLFISHTLGDVLRECDDLVVLRDGEVVGQGPVAAWDAGRLVSLMVGRELKQLFPVRDAKARTRAGIASPPLLEVRGLHQDGMVRDLSFTLHRGEILGVAGMMGAGRTEMVRILFGLDPCARGGVFVEGVPVTGGPRQRIRQGLALLTDSRREDGLCLDATVAENMALVTLARHARTPLRLLALAGLRRALAAIREAVRLQSTLSMDQPVRTLSGGNQQKVVLAKWLLAGPRALILDEPTRGIDVGARFEIYQLIHELADRGAGVLVVSSEIEELTGLCERILVMRRGTITEDLPRQDFDRERILRAALPT